MNADATPIAADAPREPNTKAHAFVPWIEWGTNYLQAVICGNRRGIGVHRRSRSSHLKQS